MVTERAPLALAWRPAAGRTQTLFGVLARRRSAAVGLALAVEVALLLAFAYADPATVVGLPAAVAAAIAGTVAVVYGPWEGAFVAATGAAVFVVAGGWGPGELATLVVWPGIVVAAGLFARRVSQQRAALRGFVAAQEHERQQLALELHDGTAQTLAAALMALRLAERAASPAAAAAASAELRQLLQQTIHDVRALAVHLRPKALDDYGFAAAVDRLGATVAEQSGMHVVVDVERATARLPGEIELALYRAAQEALANVVAYAEAHTVSIRVEREPRSIAITVADDGRGFEPGRANGAGLGLASLRDRLALLGGSLTVTSGTGAGTTVRAQVPLPG